jgi:hypothetical protein
VNKDTSVHKKHILKDIRERVDINVSTLSELYKIKTYRRRWGMLAAVYKNGENDGLYELVRGLNSDIISDNLNWRKLTFDGGVSESIIFEFDIPDWNVIPNGFYIDFSHNFDYKVNSEVMDVNQKKVFADTFKVTNNIERLYVPYDLRFKGLIKIIK